ncbi:MAG: ferritin-like domain-containing protein [bacterium]
MGIARKMVQRVRVNIDELLELLARCAAREWEIFYYYTIFSPCLKDAGGVRLQNIIEKARMEDYHHFERLVSFISEMGGEFPMDFGEFPRLSVHADPPPSVWDQSDERIALKVLIDAEKCTVQTYTNIYHLTEGKDSNANHMVSSLLEEELKHRRELLAVLEPDARHPRGKKLERHSPSLFSCSVFNPDLRLF